MDSIKPIETVYKGYRFRSRLEARWAVFFDSLGVGYEYEPEGFDLDGKWYLPDFRIDNTWIEIKPKPHAPFHQRLESLANATEKNAILLVGSPWPGRYTLHFCDEGMGAKRIDERDEIYVGWMGESAVFAVGRHSETGLWVLNDNYGSYCIYDSGCNKDGDHYSITDSKRLSTAYQNALSARFGT